jgi:hypothetical protein
MLMYLNEKRFLELELKCLTVGVFFKVFAFAFASFFLAIQVGCANLTIPQRNQVAGAVLTSIGATTPTSEIEQIYYLGVFDPQEQLPPMLYRVRVRGQSGFLSFTNFASGWVPAQVIDSLAGSVLLGNDKDKPGQVSLAEPKPAEQAGLTALSKRLFMFGPEGFRESPQNHRLVIVMGSDPGAFFGAVDEALGTVASAQRSSSRGLSFNVSNFLLQLKGEQEVLLGVATK